MPFNERHLSAFLTTLDAGGARAAPSTWTGPAAPKVWAEQVAGGQWPALSSNKQDRDQVKGALVSLADEEAWLTIMAWGGQHRKSARSSWQEREKWIPIVRALRAGDIAASEAYNLFAKEQVKGTGPAYFTKIIYFLDQGKGPRGYIMDQWTAKSMDLLQSRVYGDNLPDLRWQGVSPRIRKGKIYGWHGTVARHNGAKVYDRFCRFVEQLAKFTERRPDDIEEALFAGSRKPWREHVIAHWAEHHKL